MHIFTGEPSKEYGTRALWNKRVLAEPTREDALVVACSGFSLHTATRKVRLRVRRR